MTCPVDHAVADASRFCQLCRGKKLLPPFLPNLDDTDLVCPAWLVRDCIDHPHHRDISQRAQPIRPSARWTLHASVDVVHLAQSPARVQPYPRPGALGFGPTASKDLMTLVSPAKESRRPRPIHEKAGVSDRATTSPNSARIRTSEQGDVAKRGRKLDRDRHLQRPRQDGEVVSFSLLLLLSPWTQIPRGARSRLNTAAQTVSVLFAIPSRCCAASRLSGPFLGGQASAAWWCTGDVSYNDCCTDRHECVSEYGK